MIKFYYLLRTLQLLAPLVWGAVTKVFKPFFAGMLYFINELWESTDRIADGTALSVMNGRVLPSLWSGTLYWVFRVAAIAGMFLMIEVVARLILVIPLILSWIFTALAWLMRVLS